MLQQVLRAARLDRNLYSELIFDSYATGNAVLVVAFVYAAWYLAIALSPTGGFDFVRLISFTFSGVVRWLIVSGALWLMGTKLYPGEARIPTVLRLAGFAHVGLIPLIAGGFTSGVADTVLLVAGLAWFGIALAMVAEVSMDIDRGQAGISAFLAVAVWWVALQVLGAS